MKGNYSGEAYAMFTILDPSTAKVKATLSKSKYVYNGKTKKPALTVKIGKLTLKAGRDYSVKKTTGKNIGNYSYNITFLGNYAGATKTVKYTIAPKGTSISQIRSGNKKVNIKINKQTKHTTGYQIRYASKKKMADAKIITIKSGKKTSKSIKNLKANKKYYFQVRTYKNVKGNIIGSKWSKVKAVKTR